MLGRASGFADMIAATANGRYLFVSNQNGSIDLLRLATAARSRPMVN